MHMIYICLDSINVDKKNNFKMFYKKSMSFIDM